MDMDEIEECLNVIEHNFLIIYNGDDEDGDNKNMGC